MTIAYDASELVGWRSMPKLFLRWNGTIFHGVMTTPMFWIVNSIYGLFVAMPYIVDYHREQQYGPGNFEPFTFTKLDWGVSTMGLGLLFFFIVFYNNNSYQRFYALYGHCVGIGGTTMEWVGLVRLTLNSDSPVARWNAARLMLAATHILYYSLHGEDFDEDEWQVIVDRCLLTQKEVRILKTYGGFKPFLAITWALEEVQAQAEDKMRTDESMQRDLGQGMRAELIHEQFREIGFKFRGHCGQIINLLKEPVPFPYFHLLNLMLVIQLALTAYALASKLQWQFGLIMMVVISLVLLGMRGLAVQLSNPFGNDSVDFNIERFMGGAYKNAVAYLAVDTDHRPSLRAMPDDVMGNPLVSKTDRLGISDEQYALAWMRPNSSTRKQAFRAHQVHMTGKRRFQETRAELTGPAVDRIEEGGSNAERSYAL